MAEANDVVDDVVVDAPAAAPAAAPVAGPAPAPAPEPTGTETTPGEVPAPDAGDVKAIWPEDWRTQAAGGDEKVIAKLGRYASPQEVAKALIQVQDKISKGELRSNLGSKATPEELAAFRKEIGVPDKPEGYQLPAELPIALDQGIVKGVLEAAHATNATPQQVQSIISAYATQAKAAEDARMAAAVAARDAAIAQISSEWGAETNRNLAILANFNAANMPDDTVRNKVMNATITDIDEKTGKPGPLHGVRVGNHPDFIKMMLRVALIENPVATVSPAAGSTAQSRIQRYQELQNMMGTKAYTSNEALQAEYRNLLEAMQKSGDLDAMGNVIVKR